MTTPVRVLQLVRPALGGIRQHVLNLLDGLDPALVTNSVAAPPAFVREVLTHPQVHATIPLDIAARFSLARDLLAARRLARVLPQFAEIVHAHGARAAWVAALAHRHRPFPLIFTAHNLIGRDLPSRLGIPFVGFHCTRILAVSPSVADSLAACGVPRSKIEVIPNGVDLRRYDPALQDRDAARQALGVPENAFVVAAAARLSREKGLDTLLSAASQRAGMTFLIAGDGPLKSALKRQSPINAKLLGRVADVAPLLCAADVFAVPSRGKGRGFRPLRRWLPKCRSLPLESGAWPICSLTAKQRC